MTKVLLTKHNSPWGILARPIADNVYRHIISFDSSELKDFFVNKYLMNDINIDYKEEIEKQPSISIVFNDALHIEFYINIKDYNESYLQLLNKDTCILKDKGKYSFYAIHGERVNANIIKFEGELDIFFTYDIKNIFNNNEMEIDRAHYNETKLDLDTPNTTVEDFDSSITEEVMIPSGKIYDISFDYSEFIEGTEEEKTYINKVLNETTYLILYSTYTANDLYNTIVSTKSTQLISKIGFDKTENHERIRLPYLVSFGIISDYSIKVKYSIRHTSEESKDVQVRDTFETIGPYSIDPMHIYNAFKDSPLLVGQSVTISPIPPFNPWMQNRFNSFKIRVVDDFVEIDISDSDDVLDANSTVANATIAVTTFSYSTEGSGTISGCRLGLKTVIGDQFIKGKMMSKYEDVPIFSNNHLEEKNVLNEIKLYKSPYRVLRMKSSTKSNFDLLPEYLDENENVVNMYYSYTPDAWMVTYIPHSGIYKIHPNLNMYFEDPADYQFPSAQDAYKEYLQRNKFTNALGWINSVGGGARRGSIGRGSKAGRLAGGITGAIGGLVTYGAGIKDIKRTPDTVSGAGSSLLSDFCIKSVKPRIFEMTIPENYRILIGEFYYKYGVNWKNKLFDINKLLKTRYYFNYIKVNNCYENIEVGLSAQTKKIIETSLNQGITIWHYRDDTNWKGVKNYKMNNAVVEEL